MENIAIVQSAILSGTHGDLVAVRCSLESGTSEYGIVGKSAGHSDESAVRVRSALVATGYSMASVGVSIRTDQARSEPSLDLAIALAILVAMGTIDPKDLEGRVAIGELGLDGSIRPVRGTLAMAEKARSLGLRGIFLPSACAWEAALVPGLAVHPFGNLGEIISALHGKRDIPSFESAIPFNHRSHEPDMAEIRGQDDLVAKVCAAAASRQNLLLVGPPGSGKTMIARRISTVLPALARDEAMGITRIYSATGMASGLCEARPFRAPHHTVSAAGLVGSVSPSGIERLGEAHLASFGVLFLDELTEFPRYTLRALADALGRMPPEARPLLVASASGCPCGWFGSSAQVCRCTSEAVKRHQERLHESADAIGIKCTLEAPPLARATEQAR